MDEDRFDADLERARSEEAREAGRKPDEPEPSEAALEAEPTGDESPSRPDAAPEPDPSDHAPVGDGAAPRPVPAQPTPPSEAPAAAVVEPSVLPRELAQPAAPIPAGPNALATGERPGTARASSAATTPAAPSAARPNPMAASAQPAEDGSPPLAAAAPTFDLPAEAPGEGSRPAASAPGSTAVAPATGPEAPRAAELPALVEPGARAQAPEPPLTHEATAGVLRQIRLRLSPQLRQATIQLEPASLGRLSIRVELGRERVRAEVMVENAGTLAALERHAPELRAALAAAGLGEADVQLSLADDRGAFDAHADARANGERAQRREPSSERAPAALAAALHKSLIGADGVDTYA